jgi:hypothetical protein
MYTLDLHVQSCTVYGGCSKFLHLQTATLREKKLSRIFREPNVSLSRGSLMLKTFAPLNLSPKKIILSRTQKKKRGFHVETRRPWPSKTLMWTSWTTSIWCTWINCSNWLTWKVRPFQKRYPNPYYHSGYIAVRSLQLIQIFGSCWKLWGFIRPWWSNKNVDVSNNVQQWSTIIRYCKGPNINISPWNYYNYRFLWWSTLDRITLFSDKSVCKTEQM